jgi:hypothetical protein
MTLQEFAEQIKDCQRCMLAASRTQVVFGYGNPHAEITLVGEAPGFQEARQAVLSTISPTGILPSIVRGCPGIQLTRIPKASKAVCFSA